MFIHSAPRGAMLAHYLAAKRMNPLAASITNPEPRKRGHLLAEYIAQQGMLGRHIPIYAETSTPQRNISAKNAPVDDLYAPTAADYLAPFQSVVARQPKLTPPTDNALSKMTETPFYDNHYYQTTSGINEGLANTLGAPVDISEMALNYYTQPKGEGLGADIVDLLLGGPLGAPLAPTTRQISEKLDIPRFENSFLGSEHLKGLATKYGFIHPKVDGKGKQWARRIGQGVGEVAPVGLGYARKAAQAGKVADTLTRNVAAGLGSGLGGAAAQEFAPDNPTVEVFASILGGMSPAAAEAALMRVNTVAQSRKAIPTSQLLTDTADGIYQDLQKAGVAVSQKQAARAAQDLRIIAESEGAMTPAGRIEGSMPRVRSAIEAMDDYANTGVTPVQIRAVRKGLENAANSADEAERDAGRRMLSAFDDFAGRVSPQLGDANATAALARRAKILERAQNLAAARVNAHTGAKYDKALRAEFAKLEEDIINGKLYGFTPEEVEAIKKAAHGTMLSKGARSLSTAAPTTPFSTIPTFTVPYYLGSMIGGPDLGRVFVAGSVGAGYGARSVANALADLHADEARALVASGAPLDQTVTLTQAQKDAIAAVLATQAASNANNP